MPSKSTIKNITFRFIGFSVASLIGLATGEILVRKLSLSKTWTSYVDAQNLLDGINSIENIGFQRKAEYTFHAGRKIISRTNNLGFRDKTIVKKNRNKKRIGFTGDSVTEGFGVESENRFSEQTIDILNQDQNKFEGVNMGVSASSTVDQLVYFMKYADTISVDFLFLQICFNDFGRNSILIDRYRQANWDIDAPAQSVNTADNNDHSFFGWLQNNSAFYLFLAENYNSYKLKNGQSNSILKNALAIEKEKIDITAKLLKELNKKCEEKGILFATSYIPLEVEVKIKDDERGFAIDNKIKNICKENGIEFIELTEFLRHNSDRSLYLDDCHLSPNGHKVVADNLASFLKVHI